jgi:type II secretion system protein D
VVTLITEMIQDIEQSSAGSRRIEHFKLQNADARQMAELLRDTFSLRQQGNSLVLVPVGAEEPGPPAGGGLDSALVTPVPDERQQLAIAVDARTNTLIVSGTPDYLELVRKVITELDQIEANERERRVYSLRNAKAKDIETTLKSYFKTESDVERATLGPQLSGSLMRMLEEEVTVVGDLNSNKLVISTSPRYMSAVLAIIDELDAAPPQVMIQVLLAEITLDNAESWGMDINVGPFGGAGYRISSAAAGAGVATALGVPNLAVSSADFGILIRSLEAQGKLEVLSNPQVMVNNNQEANIQVGENIAIVDGVERTVQGTSFADVIRKDVGIILNVTPSISSDGFVRMDIKPEISQLSAKTIQVNRDFQSPIITKRAVDTVVTVKDGQSVVIGGLIQTSEEQRRTKVPILGDIPILGLPFRSKQDTNVKTELLVILTPRVIPGQAGMSESLVHDVTEEAVDRLEDPSKVQDYLERVRQEVHRKREAELKGSPGEEQGAGLSGAGAPGSSAQARSGAQGQSR